MNYDKIIIGAGIFGLYAAQQSLLKGEKVLVLEWDESPFKRASWINQARAHNGYHYPRSYATAIKSAYYFERFVHDYEFAILKDFKKIYAISKNFSSTNSGQFIKFCDVTNIPCKEINVSSYFKPGVCDGAFETLEYTFDAEMICTHMMSKLQSNPNFNFLSSARIQSIIKKDMTWQIISNHGCMETPYIINTTYASINQILTLAGLSPFNIKYELCEIILCKVSDNFDNVGITVMDGPFFSLMPFGKTGYHSLTAVGATPHISSRSTLPEFSCQTNNINCSKYQLDNCNVCKWQPKTAFMHMTQLMKIYLKEDIEVHYQKSLFAMKAILSDSEVDDSRPTIVKIASESPKFLSIFSGKINTIYDLDEVI
jgi:hypothetical protein